MTTGHVHISRGISKLGESIPSVNLPPLLTCRLDAPCTKKCYARKGRFSFGRIKDLLQRNFDIWKEDPEGFERDVMIAAYTARFFRFHSSGDIPDGDYLDMMIRVAKRCENTSFLCFTKKYEMVNECLNWHGPDVIPPNLHIVFSAWGDFVPENPYHFPVAYIAFKKQENKIPADAYPCSGFCGDCVQTGHSCWDLKPGESVYFNEH